MIQGCEICASKAPKYKCPKCYVPFCSVSCGKSHRESENCISESRDQASRPNPLPSIENEEGEWETENTVPIERLAELRENFKLREVLKNPHLCDLLKTVDSSSNPEEALQQAMKDPDFQNYVDICLGVVQESPQ